MTEDEDVPIPSGCAIQSLRKRSDGDEGEETVNDGRDTGENLDGRLGEAAKRAARILGQVDRNHQTDRHSQKKRDEGHIKRTPKQRQNAEIGTAAKLRVPDRREVELPAGIELEELDRFEQQRCDDPERGQDGDQRRSQQQGT
jgi:hypothetical protein